MRFIKSLGLNALCRILEWQVVRLRKKHHFELIAVAGSIGKTSTKVGLAELLRSAGKKVQYQTGNYNVRLTVPLVVFDQPLPGLFNVVAWAKILKQNEAIIKNGPAYEFLVLELGTDRPGEMAQFAYLKPDLGILTAIAPEHIENFLTLDAVAAEELVLASYSTKLLLNGDDIVSAYLPDCPYVTYGTSPGQAYQATEERHTEKGQQVSIKKHEKPFLAADIAYLGEQGMKIATGAVAAADMLGVAKKQILHGLVDLRPFPGRLQRLHGIKNSILLDDTYNAAPPSVLAALDVLEGIAAPQHIAILGSMNELGDYSPEAHQIVGRALTPTRVDLVVTIGADAETYLAPEAKAQGCAVVSVTSPYDAGEYVKKHLKDGAVVLAKGSQNRVFAEEALKTLLKNPEDAQKLVRQSDHWMAKKSAQFTK